MPSISKLFGLSGQTGTPVPEEAPGIVIHHDRCILSRHRYATCSRCAEACPSGGLSFDEGGPVVLLDQCTGCGICATACPTSAIEVRTQTDQELFRRAQSALGASGGEAVIACERALAIHTDPRIPDGCAPSPCNPGAIVPVACIGRIDESLIAMLAASGARGIALVHADCDSCARSSGACCAQATCDCANQLMAAWGSPARARVVGELPSCACEGAAAEHAEAAGDAASVRDGRVPDRVRAKAAGGSALPQFVPGRRKRLLASLRALGNPQDVMLDTRLFATAAIDEGRCISCRLCTTLCPTGALARIDDGSDAFVVEHRPDTCVQCGMCASLCPREAIALASAVPAIDVNEGKARRFSMPPASDTPGTPHAILHSMRKLLGCDWVYER